jgi:uncharacterized protein (DUF302 family)
MFFTGLIVGIILTAIAVVIVMPKLMIPVHESKLSVDETVAALEKAILEKGWLIPKIYNIQNTLKKNGHEDMTELQIISLCQPDYAYDILTHRDKDKLVAGIMPCRIAIYKGQEDGKTYIAEMNMGLMSKMFGGNIAKVMANVASEEAAMVAPLLKK